MAVVSLLLIHLVQEVFAERRPTAAVNASAFIQQKAHSYRTMLLDSIPSFAAFVQEHSRSYKEGTDEYHQRQTLYHHRLDQVSKQNSQPDRLWDAGVNHLSDSTDEELQMLRGWRGHVWSSSSTDLGLSLRQADAAVNVASHVWDQAPLQKALNQGSCGSCWAVATAKMAETNHLIHTKMERSFSAQELVDCTPNPHECGGTGGCSGATVELAMLYMMHQGCSTSEQTHYRGTETSCANPPGPLMALQGAEADVGQGMTMDELTQPGLKVATSAAARQINLLNWERLPVNEDAYLAAALLEGTVAVSVAGQVWASYSRGIFDGCSEDAVIDHAVVAIGFGLDTNTKKKFWTILNSWGHSWGENGRIRLLRTEDEYCGTDHQPEVGTGCKGGPSSVKVCGMCGVLYDSVLARFGSHPAPEF